jgi:hypothetical protein
MIHSQNKVLSPQGLHEATPDIHAKFLRRNTICHRYPYAAVHISVQCRHVFQLTTPTCIEFVRNHFTLNYF